MELTFIKKKNMIKYINKQTGEDVQYGENITFQESGKFDNGGSYTRTTTMPLTNSTIPALIEQGIIAQKEVEDKRYKEVKDPEEDFTLDEKIDIIAQCLLDLHDKLDTITDALFEDDGE